MTFNDSWLRFNDPHLYHWNHPLALRLRAVVWRRSHAQTHRAAAELPTYYHVADCEHEVLENESSMMAKMALQSGENATYDSPPPGVTTDEQPVFRKIMESKPVFILENTLYLVRIFCDPETKLSPASINLLLSMYIQSVSGKTMTAQINWIIQKFGEVFNIAELQGDDDDDPTSLSGNPFTKVRKIFTYWEQLKTHPLVKKLVTIFHYVLGTGVLARFGVEYDKCFFSKAEAEASQRTHDSKAGMIGAICDGVLYIVERLYDVQRTGSWQPLLHTGSEYSKWVDEVYTLKEQSLLLHNPEACGIQYHEYVSRVDAAIEKGDALVRYSQDLDHSAVLSAKRYLSEVRLIKANCLTKQAARASREAPFGLLLFGGSSIGKTSLTEIIYHYFAKVHQLKTGDDYKYTRIPADEYWSGFMSSAWCLLLDDIAAQNPNLGKDLSMAEIIQIFNRVAFTPPQADLADKGRTPVRFKLAMATTNVKNLHAHAYFTSELAIRRRLPFVISCVVKEEFAREVDGVVPSQAYDRMLDSAKAEACTDVIPNLWHFTVEKVEARPSTQPDLPQGAQLRLVEKDLDIYGLLKFIGKASQEHFQGERAVDTSVKRLEKMEVCDVCLLPTTHCECQLQSFTTVGEAVKGFAKTSACALTPISLAMALAMGSAVYDRERLKEATRRSGYRIKRDVLDHVRDFGQAFGEGVAHGAVSSVTTPVRKVKAKVRETVTSTISKLEEVRNQLGKSCMGFPERILMEREIMKTYFQEQGEKVRLAIASTNKWLYAAIVGIPMMVGAYALYKTWSSIGVQGSMVSGGLLHTQDEKPNPWFRDEYEPSTFDVGRLAASWKALSFDDVVSRISRNVGFVQCEYYRASDGKVAHTTSRFLCLGGHLCVATSHTMPEDSELQAHVTTTPVGDGINGNFIIKITQKDIFRPPGTDLAFFRLNNMPPKANLFECVPSETFRTVCNGTKIFRDPTGQVRLMPVRGIQYVVNQVRDPRAAGDFPSWQCVGTANTVSGDCGSPLVGNTPQGPHILGLHQFGGTQNVSRSVQLTRELVELAKAFFAEPVIQSGEPYLCDPQDNPILLDPIHFKAPVRYIEEGVGYAYGSFPGWRPAHKSQVCETYICKAMVERGYEVKTDKPIMKGYQPWQIATRDIVQQTFQADQSTIDECVEAYAKDAIENLNQMDFDEMIILTDLATVNGIPGVQYVDKMNRNTSMGWPYNKKKKFFMTEPHQEDIWNDAVDFDDAFYSRVNRIIERYQSGQRHMPVFMGHLKDEPTKFSKIESGATRVFLGAPADWSFVMRKYLLTFVRVLQKNKYVFEAAPGTNAASAEWEEMFRYLTFFGRDRMIAGDFSKFDKRMSAQWILAAFKVIDKILARAGWSEADRQIVACIGTDTAFPLCNMNGDLVEFWGSNPSGHPLTVIINSIVNALYMRYAWKKGGNELELFKKQVHLMTYGDDNVMGVSRDALNFSHTTIQSEMAKIGVKYTMADKESETVPYIDISDISFLKRSWRWEKELGVHVAQLEEDSIAKMLTKCLPGKVYCAERQAVDLMMNALGEYFYYGREVFEEKKRVFLEVVDELDLHPYVSREFPEFDDMLVDYREASKDIKFKW